MNAEKWEKIPFAMQMGNIGSEINRVIYWNELGQKKEKENALWRTLELLDLTIDQRKSGELLRLREIVCDIFAGNKEYNISLDYLREYFLQFVVSSRI